MKLEIHNNGLSLWEDPREPPLYSISNHSLTEFRFKSYMLESIAEESGVDILTELSGGRLNGVPNHNRGKSDAYYPVSCLQRIDLLRSMLTLPAPRNGFKTEPRNG